VAVAASVLQAGAGLVCAGEAEPLAATLEQALETPSLSMRAAALNLAESDFSWSTIALRLLAAYGRLLSPSAGR